MTVLKMKVDGAWVPVGGVRETVWAGPSAPVDPEIDLWVDTDEAALIPFTAAGTAQLVYVNATTVRLGSGVIPLNAGGVWTTRAINPMITLSNAGLTLGNLYHIYAYDAAGVTTLEASTTTPVVDAATGVSVKLGGIDRTLVGVVLIGTSNQFYDDGTYRYVRSWFSDPGVTAYALLSGGVFTTSSTSPVTLFSGPVAVMWSGENATWSCTSHAWHSAAGGMIILQANIGTGATPTSHIGGGIAGGVSATVQARVPLTPTGAGRITGTTGQYYVWTTVYTWGNGSVSVQDGWFTMNSLMTGGSGR